LRDCRIAGAAGVGFGGARPACAVCRERFDVAPWRKSSSSCSRRGAPTPPGLRTGTVGGDLGRVLAVHHGQHFACPDRIARRLLRREIMPSACAVKAATPLGWAAVVAGANISAPRFPPAAARPRCRGAISLASIFSLAGPVSAGAAAGAGPAAW